MRCVFSRAAGVPAAPAGFEFWRGSAAPTATICPSAGLGCQQPCGATLPSPSASSPSIPRDIWLAQSSGNFCFQRQHHLPVVARTAPFLLLPNTHMAALVYRTPSYLLSCVVGIKNLLLVLGKTSWQCSWAGWCTHATGIFSPTSLQGTPEVPWGVSGSGGPLPVVIHPKFTQCSQSQIVPCSGI